MSLKDAVAILKKNREATFVSSSARDRLVLLFDEGSFVETDAYLKTGEAAGVITGYGYVEGNIVFAFSQDISSDGGAIGKAHAKKIVKIYELAAETGAPVVGIYDSNGARLSEGQDALAAYGEILCAANRVSGVVPQIAVIAGTCAGTSALAACASDVVVMAEKAEFFVTSPFVAKALGDDTQGAGTASNAVKAGVAHIVAKDDKEAIAQARKVLCLLPGNNLAAVPVFEFTEAGGSADILNAQYELTESGMDIDAVVRAVTDEGSIAELGAGFGKSAITALATVGGSSCGIVATKRTDGEAYLCKNATAKIARFVRLCDSFSIPVITFADVDGFVPSSKDEIAGSIREAAKLAHVYAESTTAKISVIVGNAIGSAYIALCGSGSGSDAVFAWPGAVISALKPDAAVAFLWNDKLAGSADPIADRAKLVEEYALTEGSAFEAAAKGCIDSVIDPADTRKTIINTLDMLSTKRVSRLPKKHSNMPL